MTDAESFQQGFHVLTFGGDTVAANRIPLLSGRDVVDRGEKVINVRRVGRGGKLCEALLKTALHQGVATLPAADRCRSDSEQRGELHLGEVKLRTQIADGVAVEWDVWFCRQDKSSLLHTLYSTL